MLRRVFSSVKMIVIKTVDFKENLIQKTCDMAINCAYALCRLKSPKQVIEDQKKKLRDEFSEIFRRMNETQIKFLPAPEEPIYTIVPITETHSNCTCDNSSYIASDRGIYTVEQYDEEIIYLDVEEYQDIKVETVKSRIFRWFNSVANAFKRGFSAIWKCIKTGWEYAVDALYGGRPVYVNVPFFGDELV